MASIVLHLKFKFKYFERRWTKNKARFLKLGKAKLKKIWKDVYKKEMVF
jgi:hypothetical protein